MKWLRFLEPESTIPQFGALLNENSVEVYSGDMFNLPLPTGKKLALSDLQLLSPCVPGKLLALWNNFRAAAEKNTWATPEEPLYFVKPNNTYAAHAQAIKRPTHYSGRIIFEAELGIVISKTTKNISVGDADAHIFGYTCVNDITALELLRADSSFEQWTRAKGMDGFAPFGPCIQTDLQLSGLCIKAIVNGRERQNYFVDDMFFSPLELVSRLSRDVTLMPGDIISCGTSLGAAPWQNDAQVDVSIEGVGVLSNKLIL